jgi:hypothetical protein
MRNRRQLESDIRGYQYLALFILGFCIGYLVGGAI